MLDDLVQTITTLRERISKYGSELSKNEIRTRAVLIDPMLKVLGWDVADPARVTVEYDAGHGRADYGLKKGLGDAPVALVEAKRLNEPLGPHLGQLLNYATDRGVRYGCITDGNVWEFYRAFIEGVPLEDRRLLNVTVTEGEVAKVALSMLGLWQASLQDGEFEQAVEPLIEIETNAVPESVEQVQATASSQPTPLLASSVPQTSHEAGLVRLDEDYPTTGYPPPNVIALPGEEPISIKSWAQIPMEVALWLHRKSLLTPENCRFRVALKRYLLSPDGRHATGTAFHSSRAVGKTGIQMEVSFNPDKLVAYTCILLRHFNQDPSQVYLKLS